MYDFKRTQQSIIFPARAGLNLLPDPAIVTLEHIPRTGGVEPELVFSTVDFIGYSPHGRG